MDKEEVLKTLKKFIEEHKEDYANDALISSVIIMDEHEWKNCLTKIIILPKENNAVIRQNILYDNFALLEERVPIQQVIKILETIEDGFDIAGFKVTFRNRVHFDPPNYESSNNEFSEYPGNLYTIGGDSTRPIRHPTVKYDTPCYVEGNHAVKDWLYLSEFYGDSDGRLGKIMFFVPNFKAKITKLKLKEHKLLVKVESREDILKSLQCQVVFTFAGSKTPINKNFDGNAKVEFDINNEPEGLFVQLVTPNNEKIDYYEERVYWHTGKERVLKKEFDEELIKMIGNGENEKIEFKPFINKGDKKEFEIIRTVIAFANTKGGSILFGVSNNCEVIGIENKILKGEDASTFLDEYSKYLRKRISDKLNKRVEIAFKQHTLSGKHVLEMSITEGKNKVYCTVPDNKFYIRKGSNNRIPDPDTELPQLIKGA